MRLTFRFKLFAIGGTAAVALVILIVVSTLISNRVARELTRIRDLYVPKIEVGPKLQSSFENIPRGFQDAVAAHDSEALEETRALEKRFLEELAAAGTAVEAEQAAALRRATEEYYATSHEVSRRMIAGETGVALVEDIASMQAQQRQTAGLLKKATLFDRATLTEAFATAAREEAKATQVRLLISLACLSLVILLSVWIGREVMRSLAALAAGFGRFSGGNFALPIRVTSRDELGDVAEQANQMAANLKRLNEERDRTDWLRAGTAGLLEELHARLEPSEVADSAVGFLARYLNAVGGALHYFDDGRVLRRIGSCPPPGIPRASDELLRQATLQEDLKVFPAPPGPGEGAPDELALLPLLQAGRVKGVLELVGFADGPHPVRELLLSVRKNLVIALEGAFARSEMRRLLAETQEQAHRLAFSESELREKNKELEAFNYSVSHDLRAPLRPLAGFSQVLLAEQGSKLDDKGRDYLNRIRAAAQRMSQLIEDLLELSRLGLADMRVQPVDLFPMAEAIIADLRRNEPGREVQYSANGEAKVEGDPRLLRIVLENLLRNAWKFTKKTAEAKIEFGGQLEEGGRRALFFVRDNGAGFDAAFAERLFQPFQRLHSAAEFEGTGIGLAIVQRIIRRHGGAVRAEGAPGQGAAFFFSLQSGRMAP